MPDEHIQPEPGSRRARLDEEEDDRPRRRRRRRDEDDDEDDDRYRDSSGGVNSLIPYKNPLALTGYYMSVFSLIPCVALLLGPAAITLGVMGLNYKKKHPTAGGSAHAIVALVLGGLTSLANWGLLLTGVIAAIVNRR